MMIQLLLLLSSYQAKADVFTLGFLSGNRYRNGTPAVSLPGIRISAAIQVAVDEINNANFLPFGHKLEYILAETFGNESESILQTAELWKRNISGFIGPQETCAHEARLAGSFNLPMISHFCTNAVTSDKAFYPTFARTRPPASLVSKSLTSLLLHFGWRNVALISTETDDDQDVLPAIETSFYKHSITILARYILSDYCYFGHEDENVFENWLQSIRNEARIFVIIGQNDCHLSFLEALNQLQMLDKRQYFVIGVNTQVWNKNDPSQYLKGVLSSAINPLILGSMKHYLGIMASPEEASNDSWSYQAFCKSVLEAMKKEPFADYFTDHYILDNLLILRREAAYLYDAVKLYAQALRDVLLSKGNPLDGRQLMQRLKNKTYTSALGFQVYMNENGDAQGNYTLLSLQTINNTTGLFPIGNFAINSGKSLPELHLKKEIDWPKGSPPRDVPICGFSNELCLQEYSTREIIMGVSGGIAVVLSVVIILAYRNYKYEQELDSLLWKIDSQDIHEDQHTPTAHGKTSQMSLNSHNGEDCRYSNIYTRVGFYKGRLYAIKRICPGQLVAKVELTRNIKKELKYLRDLNHDNINAFIGACVEPEKLCFIRDYCPRGSLKDILNNDEIKLDNMFVASLVFDIIRGMIYLHDSPIGFHGNLKITNCLVDSRWVLKLTDFGPRLFQNEWLPDLIDIVYKASVDEDECENLLYLPPELLRSTIGFADFSSFALQKADAYSFAMILYKLISQATMVFGNNQELKPSQILIRLIESNPQTPLRPDFNDLPTESGEWLRKILKECWSENPCERPDFKLIRTRLRPLRKGMRANIFDNMLAMMEKYADNLESLVDDRTYLLFEEKRKTEALLHEMLPKPVAEQLKHGNAVEAESYDCVTIFFSDIVGFTEMCSFSTPLEVVDFLNDLYTCFDENLEHYDVYKVETIGDAYMVSSGVPVRNGNQHAGEIASFALELLDSVSRFSARHRPKETVQLRIGIHSGPVCSGVVGRKMPRFCLFGDTVNTASRMESTGEPLKIHCSEPCKAILDQLGGYYLESRGITTIKGKGEMSTFWLKGQDLTPAKLRALSRRGTYLSNRSYASSVQELDLFRNNPKLSSRRGSCRRSGSYLEQLSPGFKMTTSALAFAINNQLAATTKPLAKIDPFSNGTRNNKEDNIYLNIPTTNSLASQNGQQYCNASSAIVSPCSSVHSRISTSLVSSSSAFEACSYNGGSKLKDDPEAKRLISQAKEKRNLQFSLPPKHASKTVENRRVSIDTQRHLAEHSVENSPLLTS